MLDSLKLQVTETTDQLAIGVQLIIFQVKVAVGAIVSFIAVAVIHEATTVAPESTTLQLKLMVQSTKDDKSIHVKLIHQLQSLNQLQVKIDPEASVILKFTMSPVSRVQLNTMSKL